EARTLARLGAQYAGEGPGEVVGFGLSNDERRGATSEFAAAVRIARRAGLAAVPHGGELPGADPAPALADALAPGPPRHGVPPLQGAGVRDRLVASEVAREVCPASNVSLGVCPDHAEVPLRTLVEAGATVALGADDPLLFGSRLVAQYEHARTVHGLADEVVAGLARGSIRASTASEATKARLLARVDAWLAAEPKVETPA